MKFSNTNLTIAQKHQKNNLILQLSCPLIAPIKICNKTVAQLLCKLIPASCPFAQDIHVFGYTLHIPALCKLNPFYKNLMEIRWQALSFLADICREDISEQVCKL
jgi:hypothetical protein